MSMPPVVPFLKSASLIVCEKALIEADGVLSAIRMVDLFFVPQPSDALKSLKKGDAIPSGATQVLFTVIVNLRGDIGYKATHKVQLKIFNTVGEWGELGPPVDVDFDAKVDTAPSFGGFYAQTSVVVRNLGTVQICAFVDDQEVVRTPLTFTLQPESHA